MKSVATLSIALAAADRTGCRFTLCDVTSESREIGLLIAFSDVTSQGPGGQKQHSKVAPQWTFYGQTTE